MTTHYASHVSHGTASDSGIEGAANSPRSISDHGNYTSMPMQSYSQPDQSTLSSAPDSRSMIAVSYPYTSVGAYSYPAMCHPQNVQALSAPVRPWEMQPVGPPPSAPTNSACYNYLDPSYSMHETH